MHGLPESAVELISVCKDPGYVEILKQIRGSAQMVLIGRRQDQVVDFVYPRVEQKPADYVSFDITLSVQIGITAVDQNVLTPGELDKNDIFIFAGVEEIDDQVVLCLLSNNGIRRAQYEWQSPERGGSI